MRKVVRVRIHGHVQGVWYRAWTVDTARKHGLAGWVRNRTDGSVEAVFAGESDAVEAAIAACHRGPELARVDAVERADAADEGWTGFGQLPTTE